MPRKHLRKWAHRRRKELSAARRGEFYLQAGDRVRFYTDPKDCSVIFKYLGSATVASACGKNVFFKTPLPKGVTRGSYIEPVDAA